MDRDGERGRGGGEEEEEANSDSIIVVFSVQQFNTIPSYKFLPVQITSEDFIMLLNTSCISASWVGKQYECWSLTHAYFFYCRDTVGPLTYFQAKTC